MTVFRIRRTVFTNLIAIFIVLSVPVYVLNVYMARHAEQNVLERSIDAINLNARYFLDSFETEIERIDRLKNEYLSNDDFLKLANEGPYLDPYSRNELILSVKDKLQILKTSSPFVQDVKVYFPSLDRGVFASSYENRIPEEDVAGMLESYRSDATLYASGTGLSLGGMYPVPLSNDNFVLSMEIVLSKPNIEQLLRNIGGKDSYECGSSVLYNPELGWAVSDRGEWLDDARLAALTEAFPPEAEPATHKTITVNEQKFMVMKERSERLGVHLIVSVPEAELTGILQRYKNILYVVPIVSLFIIFAFGYGIYRLIHQPFQKLMAGLRRIEKGDYEVNLTTRKGDEFSIVYRQFNSMARRLKVLIEEVYEHKIRLQLSELKQLQSQINPHFLYNSYYAIYRLAQRHDVDKVAEYTRFLGEYLQYITRNASDTVALADEMKHAEAYVRIQMLRFSNRIKTEFEPLPEGIGQLQVPKLILQPLIENAYTHGVGSKLQDGLVKISFVRSDRAICIVFEDNGDELSDDALAQLSGRLNRINDNMIEETTGMMNVHKRLQLKFGKAYGLVAERSGLGGLKVTMALSCSEEGEGTSGRSGSDV